MGVQSLEVLVRSSKLKSSRTESSRSWYSYYAGYTVEFVSDVLTDLQLPTGSIVLDPWNGTGTTTDVAMRLGHCAYGYDLNPVMTIVARARSTSSASFESALGALGTVLDLAKAISEPSDASEPLATWFTPSTAGYIRSVERATRSAFNLDDLESVLPSSRAMNAIAGASSLIYTALFRLVRSLVVPMRSSNPTWIRLPQAGDPRIVVSPETFDQRLRDGLTATAGLLRPINGPEARDPVIETASSRCLPMGSQVADTAITSPPYCTRIDYAVATRPELAVLSYSPSVGIRSLRDQLLGTPTLSEGFKESRPEWGDACVAFLDAVKSHSSKASGTYYFKTLCQYFDGLYQSLSEVERTLKRHGTCILVVQDSYYKNLHNDLAAVIIPMVASLGWELVKRADFDASPSLVAINGRAWTSGRKPRETALWFQNCGRGA